MQAATASGISARSASRAGSSIVVCPFLTKIIIYAIMYQFVFPPVIIQRENIKVNTQLCHTFSISMPAEWTRMSRRTDKNVMLKGQKYQSMWLENLKELRKKTGLSSKQIADKANLPERTVVRIFSGDTDNPYVDTLHRIVTVLGGSLDDVLADSKTVLGTKNLATLQEDAARLGDEVSRLKEEIAALRDRVTTLSAENDILRLNLEHKEELLALHDYYNKRKSTMQET